MPDMVNLTLLVAGYFLIPILEYSAALFWDTAKLLGNLIRSIWVKK